MHEFYFRRSAHGIDSLRRAPPAPQPALDRSCRVAQGPGFSIHFALAAPSEETRGSILEMRLCPQLEFQRGHISSIPELREARIESRSYHQAPPRLKGTPEDPPVLVVRNWLVYGICV
jgi:hypothetical protein